MILWEPEAGLLKAMPCHLKVRLGERLVTPWTEAFWYLKWGYDQDRQAFGFTHGLRVRN